MNKIVLMLVGAAAFAAAGCGGENRMMTGPGPAGVPVASPSFMSVSPGGGAMGVPAGSTLEFHWGTAMDAGMEQYVDLHMGDLAGPVRPMSCTWSTDRTTLVCTPSSSLQAGTRYTIHVGGGMVDANGPGFGGQWIQGGMMGTGHAGRVWGMMGGGWRHSNGAYGMAFTFTTA